MAESDAGTRAAPSSPPPSEDPIAALRTSEAKYRMLTENMKDVVWTLDPETARFVYVSPSVERLRGFTPEEIAVEPFDAALVPEAREHIRSLTAERVAAFRAAEGWTADTEYFTEQVAQPCKDGTTVWTEVVTHYFRDPDTGRVLVAGLTRDITDRKRAADALQESERMVQSILDTTPNLIYIYDIREGRNVYANREVSEFLGYTPEQITAFGSELFSTIMHPEDLASVAGYHARIAAAADGEVFTVNYRMRHADGEWRWLHSRDVPFARGADGAVTQILGFTEDATQQVLLDQQLLAGTQRLEKMVHDVTEVIGKVVEARDPYTQGHERRVAQLGKLIAVELGLPQSEVDAIEMAALVHDVGKLSVPTEILIKPGKLSDTEFALVKGHSEAGCEILQRIDFGLPIADIVLQHHERMDGTGYPLGLAGSAISMAARVLAVADVVEAMSSHRPYRSSLGLDAGVAEVRNNPRKYDPDVVAACYRLFEQGRIEFDPEADGARP